MKKFKLVVSILLIMQLVVGSFTTSAADNRISDIQGHWAETTIQQWLDKGLVSGYPDGNFKPNNSISRAEFVKIVNNTFNVSEAISSQLSFSDITDQHWAYREFLKAIDAGFVSGTSETTLSPNASIARQEAAVMLVKLLGISGLTELDFKDVDQIAAWSKDAITALVAKGLLEGDPSGNVRPKGELTRAEAIVLIDKVSKAQETVFDQAGTYGNSSVETTITGNVRISSTDVTLVNTKITGNLIIDKAVAEGNVTLKQVTVLGDTIVQGGGENSIHLDNSVLLRIIADKASGKVRIVAIGATTVQEVMVQSSVKLEESQLTGSGFKNVELASALPSSATVELVGQFESVDVIASNIQITLSKGSVNEFTVDSNAKSNEIHLSSEATIQSLLLEVVTKILGKGTIEKAVIGSGAEASSFETKPKVVENENPIPTALPENPGTSTPIIPGPQPSPTTSPEPSSDASIHNVVFNSEVEFNWIKINLLANSGLSNNGFNTNHSDYVAFIPKDIDSETIALTLEYEENVNVTVRLGNNDTNTVQSVQENSDGNFEFQIDPLTHYELQIHSTSEDGEFEKHYIFNVFPEKEISEAFRLVKNDGNYYIESYVYMHEDVITVTVPDHLTNTGEEEVFIYTIKDRLYSSGFSTAQISLHSYESYLKKFDPNQLQDELYIEVSRQGEVIASGNYAYDLTPIQLVELDPAMYEIEFFTSAELNEINIRNNYEPKMSYQYTMFIDIAEFKSNYGDFKYLENSQPFLLTDELVVEDVKMTYYNYGIRAYNVSSETDYSITQAGYFYPSDDLVNGKYEIDGLIHPVIYLYDENKNIIKVLRLTIEIPDDALAENVIKKVLVD